MEKECTTCGGSGQIGYFQGVSRFLITWEECPECCGTGYIDSGRIEKDTLSKSHKDREKPRKKTG